MLDTFKKLRVDDVLDEHDFTIEVTEDRTEKKQKTNNTHMMNVNMRPTIKNNDKAQTGSTQRS